ncbi:MAG: branched-chain amino acid ABC transporter permease [Rhizobiaceae bacterium]
MNNLQRSHFVGLAILAIAAVFLASVPVWGSSFLKRSIIEFLYLLALAQVWNFMAGYAGLISIGQQGWVGIGAYALVVLADDLGIDPFLSVPLAGLVVALMAWPITWLLFRLRGAYFAVGTWVLAETIRLAVTANIDWLGGGRGRTLRAVASYDRYLRENLSYLVVLAMAAGSIAVIYLLLRSKTGLALMAMRDSEVGAAGVGVGIVRTKRLVYVLAAGIAGAVGALIYLNLLNVRPDAAFSINWAAYVIFIVIIGGIGTLEGPIIGTIVFFLLRRFLFDFEEWSLIIFGGIAVAVMIVAPRGLWGLVSKRFGIELFPIRQRMPGRLAHATM